MKRWELTVYSFYDWAGWRRHLEKMAQKGWQLEKISNFGVKYRRCAPQEVQYAVTYLAEASELHPHPPESQQTLEEFCAAAGWVSAASWHQMQVFRGAPDAPAIETDAVTQVETIHRAMKKNFLPGHIMLAVLAAVQLCARVSSCFINPIAVLHSNTELQQWALWLLLLLLCGVELLAYSLWLRRARKLARREGVACSGRSHPAFQRVLVWLIDINLVLWLFSFPSRRQRIIALCSVGVMACLLLIVNGAKYLFKRLGVSAGVNRVLIWVVSVVCAFALIFGADSIVSGMNFAPDEVSADDLPVSMQDLGAEIVGEEVCSQGGEASPLLSFRYATQSAGGSELWYHIYESPFEGILDTCLKELMSRTVYTGDSFQWEYRATDPAPWHAEAVWVLYRGEECRGEYLVRWEHRLLRFSMGQPLTQQQMGVIAEALTQA